jgi:RNase P/RNase MRP subunit p29
MQIQSHLDYPIIQLKTFKMTDKKSYHKKMIGKKVQVSLSSGEDIQGLVSKIIDEETFLIQDLDTHDFIEASIFDIRSN